MKYYNKVFNSNLNESAMHIKGATDFVNWMYREYPEIYFIDEKKTKNGNIRLVFDLAKSDITDLFTDFAKLVDEVSYRSVEYFIEGDTLYVDCYDDEDWDTLDESYKKESAHTDLVDQFFADVQDVVDYFKYHNKNLNKTQDYLLYDLEDALDSRSTIAAREAIANLKNHSKGMNNMQSSMIEELYGELFAGGEYKDLGRPSYDESYKKESVTDEYIEITMYDGDVRRYNRDTDLEKFQYDWSEDIRDLVGDDVSSGEIDDIARELFYYEIPNTDDELTDDDIYEMIRQMLEYDSPNSDNDAWDLYTDGCKPKKKKKKVITQGCGKKIKKESGKRKYTQRDIKDYVAKGMATDITHYGVDEAAKFYKDHNYDVVGISHGTYGMNGALLQDVDTGEYFAITARNSTLFQLV